MAPRSTLLIAAGLALSGATLLGCVSTRTQESGGEYVDNSVITAKVKAALLEEPTLKSFQISVESYRNVVQLSGFVDSAQSVRRAGEVAAGITGVSSVKNDPIAK